MKFEEWLFVILYSCSADHPHYQEGPDNEFEIVWEEDHIISYKYPRMFALKRPTWEVNPTRKIEDFKIAFLTDMGDAMMRFLCTPTFSSDSFFKQRDKLFKSIR